MTEDQNTKRILLTQGMFAFVDAEDYERVSKFKWHVHKVGERLLYAARGFKVFGKSKSILMHRYILSPEQYIQIDHINHNGLDNRKSNLRVCTGEQNQGNRRKNINTTSKFKGVRWHSRDEFWTAQIQINGKQVYLGYFSSEIEAAVAYNKAASDKLGPFAFLNRIE